MLSPTDYCFLSTKTMYSNQVITNMPTEATTGFITSTNFTETRTLAKRGEKAKYEYK